MKNSLIVRPATKEDIETFAPDREKPSIRAWVGDLDGEIIALGGVAFTKGRWFAFLDLTERARPYKMTLARAALRFFAEMRKDGIRYIYAEADLDEPTSLRWLTSLGFTLDPRTLHLYRWSA